MIREFNNPELAPRNSFHVAQRAARLIEFDRTEDLQELFEKGMPDPWYVLGGGNNVLFTQDYPGTLLTPVAQGIRIVDEQPDCVTVEADAGVEWDDLVEWAVQHELWGLENLSLIPGKVGAAPVQNIGAYGCEAKDAIRSVEMFCTETFNTLVLNREHCAFGYRDSVFKRSLRGRVIITSDKDHKCYPWLGGSLRKQSTGLKPLKRIRGKFIQQIAVTGFNTSGCKI